MRTPGKEREHRFKGLCRDAAGCRLCPRMADRAAVLGRLNGSLFPKVLFVGEAPGRRGAEVTRKPFCGDASGQRFEQLLASIELTREDVFITNAALCCPADERRNNTPTACEIRNCRPFLQRTIELLSPRIVATVGAVALKAVEPLIDHRQLRLSEVAGTVVEGSGFRLVPLYHPSPRVLNTTRSLGEQQTDFAAIGRLLKE